MNNSFLRGFGIACIFLGISLILIRLWAPEIFFPDQDKEIQQLKVQLNEANHQITALKHQLETASMNKNEAGGNASLKGNQRDDEVTDKILSIYSGMTPLEVAKALEDMDVIDHASDMELLLSRPEYARSIQMGQFAVNSNMTMEEIADLITGKQTESPDSE